MVADRTVTYRFRGDFASLTAGLAASGRSVADLGTKLTAADRAGAKYRRGLTTLGSTAGKMGLVAAAGIAVMVKATADFDQAMSNVNATGAATTAQLADLRKAALEAGQTTRFSATEAASGIEALLKAGVSASDVIGGGLSGALALAAAGEIDVGAAAEDAASAMTQFKLQGKDVPHIADLLAAGAGKAQGDVADLAEALNAGGLTAAQFGVSIDDTVGTLTAFAAAGLLGSTAGTVMKQMLLKLAAPSVKAANTMEDLGISAYDASGKFVGFTALAGELQAKLSTLAPEQRNAALATIFGSRAIQGANVLYADGAKGIQDWNQKVLDQGYAVDVAGKRLDNLAGDLHKFKSALDVAFIGQGEGSTGFLRGTVQDLTDTVNAFAKLPGPIHTATNAGLAFTAVFGAGTFLTSRVINGLGTMNVALKNLGVNAGAAERSTRILGRTMGAAAGLTVFAVGMENANRKVGTFETTIGGAAAGLSVGGPWGAAIGGAVGLLAGFAAGQHRAVVDTETLTSTLDQQTGAITQNTAAYVAKQFAEQGILADAQKLGISLSDVTQAALGNTDALDRVNTAAAAYQATIAGNVQKQADFADTFGPVRDAIAGTATTVGDATTKIGQIAAAAPPAADAVTGLAGAAQDNASAQDTQTAAINKANQAMKKQVDAALSAFDAETQYRQAVKDATAQSKKSQAGIKGNSDEALANRAALSDLASAWNNQSAAVKNNVAKFKEAKQNFITTATAMKVPEAAAKALADQILNIPRSVIVKAQAQTAAAQAALNTLQNFKFRDKFITVHTVQVGGNSVGSDQTAHGGTPRAAGGPIVGPGGPTADRVPVMASNGEFMMRAAAVRHYGLDAMYKMNALRLADGGLVASTYARTTPNNGSSEPIYTLGPVIYQLGHFANDAAGGLKALKHQLDVVNKAYDKQKAALDAIRSTMADLASTVSGRFAVDLSAKSSTSNAYADNLVAQGIDPATANSLAMGMGTSSSPLSAIASATAQATQMTGIIRQLKKWGLSGPALAQILSQMSLSDLQALIAAGPGEAHAYQSALNGLYAAQGQTGHAAAQAAYGGQESAQAKATRALHQQVISLEATVKAQTAELKKATAETGPDRTAHGVAAAVGGAVAGQQRTKRGNSR